MSWQWLLFALAIGQPSPPGEVIEQVVAVVERQTITLLDVKRASALEIAKLAGERALSEPWPDELLSDVRKLLIQRTLLLEEARRYAQPEPTDKEIDAAVAALRARFSTERAFSTFMTQALWPYDELKADLKRALLVDRFLNFRIKSRIEISTEQLRSYRSKHPEAARVPDDAIIKLLIDESFAKRTREYLKELVERADIRLIGELRPSTEPTSP